VNGSSSRLWAWTMTVASSLLAIAPGGMELVRGREPTYDASLAVLTATLITVIWYTQYTFETLQHSRNQHEVERQRSRRTVATGLLEELKWLDGILAQIYQHGPYSFYDPLAHPMLDVALAQSALFESATMESLTEFHALLRDCRAMMNEYRDRRGALHPSDKVEYVRFIRTKAAFTAAAMPMLIERLVSEGGERTERRLDGGWHQPGVPPLIPSPFGRRYGEE